MLLSTVSVLLILTAFQYDFNFSYNMKEEVKPVATNISAKQDSIEEVTTDHSNNSSTISPNETTVVADDVDANVKAKTSKWDKKQNIVNQQHDLTIGSNNYTSSLNTAGSNITDNNIANIEIHPGSNITNDIISITHFQSESKVIMQLKNERFCKQPQLIGRLSGPVLTKIDWEDNFEAAMNGTETTDNSGILTMIGHYDLPVSGRYFIEIIVTTCTYLSMETDFRQICLVDPTQHRLTLDGETIDVVVHTPTPTDTALLGNRIGYWYNVNQTKDPLYTRFQPQVCRRGYKMIQPRCAIPMNISRFDPYKFKHSEEGDFSIEKIVQDKEAKVCFEGASHARYMFQMLQNMMIRLENTTSTATNVEIIGTYHKQYTKYTYLFTAQKIQSIINKNCTKVVVNTGQWDASREGHTSFVGYENTLKTAMVLMKDMFRAANIDLYFRSTQ